MKGGLTEKSDRTPPLKKVISAATTSEVTASSKSMNACKTLPPISIPLDQMAKTALCYVPRYPAVSGT